MKNDLKTYVDGNEQDEVELKRDWWRQLYSRSALYQPFPLVKAIVLLDQSRYEYNDPSSDVFNYKVVFATQSVRDAFNRDIFNTENSQQVAYAMDIRVGVNGLVRMR